MKIPTEFRLDKKATAIEAFTEIVKALGLDTDPNEARMWGRARAAIKEEIGWGVSCETEIALSSDVGPGGLTWRIEVKISTSGTYRSPAQARMLARMLSEAADVGFFVEAATGGRTWTDKESGIVERKKVLP